MTTAFVAGATGYTGREVVRALRDRGIETVAHVRPDSPRLEEWRRRFEGQGAIIDSTPWELEAMTATLRRLTPDLVFSLLGTTRRRMRAARKSGAATAGYGGVDVGLTLLLHRAACEAAPECRFVYLSSVGVREAGGNAYLAARGRVEQVLRAGRVAWSIARPSIITGPDRDEVRVAERLAAVGIDGVLRVAGWFGGKRVEARYRSTTNVVLGSALVRIALDPRGRDRIFESEELR